MTTTNYRADHVGSLLRPPELLQARDEFSHGRISQEQLKEIEDRSILTALDMQRQVGIEVLTDGEYRRHDWVGDFTSSVDGYVSRSRSRRAASAPCARRSPKCPSRRAESSASACGCVTA